MYWSFCGQLVEKFMKDRVLLGKQSYGHGNGHLTSLTNLNHKMPFGHRVYIQFIDIDISKKTLLSLYKTLIKIAFQKKRKFH